MDQNLGLIFLSELVGTAMLVLLGCGVVANVVLKGNKGFGGGFLMINFGWGLAVFAGVVVAAYSGAHLNPAVTFGLWANSLATGGDFNAAALPAYLGGAALLVLGVVDPPLVLGGVLAYEAIRRWGPAPRA